MALNYHFDLYPRTNPLGARLVRFTNLQSAQFRGEANGTGSGEFTIRADDSEADFIDPLGLQYVRVVRDDDSTELVVGGFFLERGEYKALDEDETKLLKFGGAGPLTIFQRAVMDADSWIDDPFIGTDPQPEGVWPLYLAGTGNELGAILWRVLHELEEPGRHQDPLPFTSLGFTHLVDSNAAAWVRTTGDFSAQVSESVLSIVRRLMQLGLYVEVDPDTFEVRAFEPETHRRDRTGGAWAADVVRFQAPTAGDILTGNIKSDATRALEAVVRRNAILTGSADTWLWVDDPGVTVPWEGGYILDDEAGTSLLKAGEAQLSARSDAGDVLRLRMRLGDDEANGVYLPFEHVLLDDLVTVHTGTGQWDYNEAEFPVAALTIVLRPGGDWDAWADLGASYLSMAERAFQVSSGQCNCPPNPQLCRITTGIPPTIEDSVSAAFGSGTDTLIIPGGLTNSALIIAVGLGPFGTGLPSAVNWTIGASDYPATLVSSSVAGGTGLALYRLVSPVAGTGAVNADNKVCGVWLLSGVDQTTPVTYTFASGTGTVSSVSTAAGPTNERLDAVQFYHEDFTIDGGTFGTLTATGGQTQDAQRLNEFGSPGYSDQLFGIGHGDASPGWTGAQSRPWVAAAIAVNGSGVITGDTPQSVGGNAEAAVGTSIRASRCDHVHDHSDLSDHSDEIHHHADSIEGLVVGAPTTADYLVGTAQAGLSAEIVVGTTPGGELGNTWASPTVDATHAGSNHLQPVRKNSTGSVFTRRQLNFIEGTNVTLIVADDAGNDEVDVTIASTGGGSGVTVEDEGTPLATVADTLDFVGAGVVASGVGTTKTITISGASVADILDLPTAETDDTLVLAPDGAGGVEFRAEAGGSGGWTLDVDQNGASFASWTALGGTWASDGTNIQQTNNSATERRAYYTTRLDLTEFIAQVEIRFPTTGQGTAPNVAALLLGFDGSTATGSGPLEGGLVRATVAASSTIALDYAGVAPIGSATVTLNLDTWYTLRCHVSGHRTSLYLDGTLMRVLRSGTEMVAIDYIGLETYSGIADFRNIKVWTLTQP